MAKELTYENDWTSRLDKLWSGSVAGQLTLLTEMAQSLLDRPNGHAEDLERALAALHERVDALAAAIEEKRPAGTPDSGEPLEGLRHAIDDLAGRVQHGIEAAARTEESVREARAGSDDAVRSLRDDALSLASVIEDRARQDGDALRAALGALRDDVSVRIDRLAERVDAVAGTLGELMEWLGAPRATPSAPPSANGHSNGDAGRSLEVDGQTADEPAVAMHGVIDLAPL